MWFSLSDEGVEDAIYDSYAMRGFLGLELTVEQVPDVARDPHLSKMDFGRRPANPNWPRWPTPTARYRGMAKNRTHLHVLFASANGVMRARAVGLDFRQ